MKDVGMIIMLIMRNSKQLRNVRPKYANDLTVAVESSNPLADKFLAAELLAVKGVYFEYSSVTQTLVNTVFLCTFVFDDNSLHKLFSSAL